MWKRMGLREKASEQASEDAAVRVEGNEGLLHWSSAAPEHVLQLTLPPEEDLLGKACSSIFLFRHALVFSSSRLDAQEADESAAASREDRREDLRSGWTLTHSTSIPHSILCRPHSIKIISIMVSICTYVYACFGNDSVLLLLYYFNFRLLRAIVPN